MKTRPLRVRFGSADVGSLPVSISTHDGDVTCTASFLAPDLVLGFIGALLAITESRAAITRTVILFEEPAERAVTFTWSGPEVDILTLQVVAFLDERRVNRSGQVQLVFKGTRVTVLLAFWRALRDLEARAERESFATLWRGAFPSRALKQLTSALEALRKHPGAA